MKPVLCDFCGEPIARLDDGWVQWILDDFDMMVVLTLVHAYVAKRGCTYHERRKLGHLQDHHASVFVDPRGPHVAHLRGLARAPEGASVSRLLAKVRRLAAVDRQGAERTTPDGGA